MTQRAARLLRETRRAARLTQSELAARAGTTQSAISAYESGRRDPTVSTLEWLLGAAGALLVLEADSRSGCQMERTRLTPEVISGLKQVAEKHGITDVRLFGSVARGEATPESDLDLLVTLPAGMTLWGLAGAADELSEIAGVRVDLVPEADLRPAVRGRVLAEAVAL